MADSLNLELESNAEEYELTLGDDSQRYLELTVEDKMYEVEKGGGTEETYIRCGSSYNLTSNVTEIGDYAFVNNQNYESADFPKAKIVGALAFLYNVRMKTGSFPLVKSVGNRAFGKCNALTSIDLSQATTFGDEAFYSCISLTSIDLPQATTFGTSAFSSCSKLEKIVLEKVESIKAYELCYNCSALTAFVIKNENAVCSLTASFSSMFSGTPIKSGTGYIYVPDALVDSYKAADGWSTFASQIKPLSELPSE